MALSRYWAFPESATESVSGEEITHTAPQATGGPGFSAGLDSLQVPNIVTAPANSSLVTSYVTQSASVVVATQNTLGYDAEFVGYVYSTNASVATFAVGVGATSPPAVTTVATPVTSALNHVWTFPAYVPSGYYYAFQATQANGAGVNGLVTIVANPV